MIVIAPAVGEAVGLNTISRITALSFLYSAGSGIFVDIGNVLNLTPFMVPLTL